MINTIGDLYFTEHPEKVLGEVVFGFRGRIEVSGNEKTIKLYFHKGISKEEKIYTQKEKAEELIKALEKEGYHPGNSYTSKTDFGISTYVTMYDELGIYRTFRISDHSVTNTQRIFNEIHYSEKSDINNIIKELKERIQYDSDLIKKRNEGFKKLKDRQNLLDQKWVNMKPFFEGLIFKQNKRTYQNLKEFSAQKQRSNIYQKPLDIKNGQEAYYYEWTEPKEDNEYGSEKPSNEYIENFNFPENYIQNPNSETLNLIATLELIPESDRDAETVNLLEVLKLSL